MSTILNSSVESLTAKISRLIDELYYKVDSVDELFLKKFVKSFFSELDF